MAARTCERCNKVFKRPAHLRDHLNRKTPCSPIVGADSEPAGAARVVCRFCNRSFVTRSSLTRHINVSCPIAPNARNGGDGMMILYEHTKRNQPPETVEKLEAKVSELEAKLERMAEALAGASAASADSRPNDEPRAGHAVSGGIAVGEVSGKLSITTNNIFVNVFGKEELDHATGDRIREILDDARGRITALSDEALPVAAQTAVLRAAMLIFSSPENPENLTAYLPNKKLDDVMVHGTGGWEVQPAHLVLAPMATKALDVLFDKQPYENAEDYTALMVELRDNEARYAAGEKLRPILVRNKDLLARALGSLPIASPAGQPASVDPLRS